MAAPTFEQIIEIAQRSGIPNNPGSTMRPGAVTKSGNVSNHASGRAVDFIGHSQDALAEFFMRFPTLEVFHKSDATGKWYGSSKGKPVDEQTHQQLVADHRNHLHVAMSEEQVGPGSVLDMMRKGIAVAAGAAGTITGTLGKLIPNPANVTEAITNVGTAANSLAQSAMSMGRFAEFATRLFMPTVQLRIYAGIFGAVSLLIGIWFISREIRESKA